MVGPLEINTINTDKKARAVELFNKGCSWREVAEGIPCALSTLWVWSKQDPEFNRAIRQAQADPDHQVEAVTFHNACDPDPAHNTLRIFWLKSRKGYTDRLDLTSNGKPYGFIDRAHNPRDASASTNGHVAPESLAEAMGTD